MIEGAHENGEPGVIYLERVNKEHSFDTKEHPDHRISRRRTLRRAAAGGVRGL